MLLKAKRRPAEVREGLLEGGRQTQSGAESQWFGQLRTTQQAVIPDECFAWDFMVIVVCASVR